MSACLTQAAARGVAWAKDHALPLWCARGWDPAGGFVERLHPEGTPDRAADRRVRVQARQIAVMCQAALAGWSPDAGQLARAGADWFFQRCRARTGAPGFVHVVSATGEVVDPRRDTYDQAFALYAMSWLYRLDGDSQILGEIDTLFGWMDEALWDRAHDGYLEGDYEAPHRRQNPNMHAFEAMMALYEATGEARFLAQADRLFALFRDRLFDGPAGVLREHFTYDWRVASSDVGRVVEPGHHFEWVWLLAVYERLSGVATGDLRAALWLFAVRFGFAPTGFVMDACWDTGAPHTTSQRFWPQTEFVKAVLAVEESAMTPHHDDRAACAGRMIAGWFETFLDVRPRGGWVDRLTATGEVADPIMPASTGYHVMLALREAERVRLLPNVVSR